MRKESLMRAFVIAIRFGRFGYPGRGRHPCRAMSCHRVAGRDVPWAVVSWMIVLGVVGVTGCGPTGPTVEPVSGTVFLDGAPVSGATVVLTPTAGGLAATGLSGADGRFTVATVTAGKSWPGAAQGEYSVTATKVEAAAGAVVDPNDPKYDPLASVNPGSGPKYVIPKDYGEQGTSGLTATITKGKNDLKFELDSKFKAAK